MLLLRAWYRSREPQLLQMVEVTLDAMARGGIHDQLGGGFHRYSTDEQWLVPHFEKMLYDQALLARAYLEAYQATGLLSYADVARDIFEYVLRDMRDKTGAFYSAEDAGAVGKEGEFYVWTIQQVEETLSPKVAAVFNRFYDVTPGGNFEGGAGILHVGRPLEVFAQEERLSADELRTQLRQAREALLAARNGRQRPHRDDKILTDWNGLMIGALAYGARVLDEPRYAEAAREAALFLLTRLRDQDHLLHRFREGEASIPAFLDDYAFLAWGLLDLYEATFDVRWLKEAQRLTKEMIQLFWDTKDGGFFFSGERNEQLIARSKELYDGAVPSGNSVAALTLTQLSVLTMDGELREHAQQLFQAFSGPVSQAPHAFPQLLVALDLWLGPSQEIVIAGDPGALPTKQLVRTAASRFLPRAVVAFHPTGDGAEEVEALMPFLKMQHPLDGQPTVYICQEYLCNLPTTDAERMVTLLESLR